MKRWDAVLNFWFGDLGTGDIIPAESTQWFNGGASVDEAIRQQFLETWQQARRGELSVWRADPRGRLALVILLDQFSRHLGRGTAEAFAQDSLALAIVRDGVARGDDLTLFALERAFYYLPFEHSESLADQEVSIRLYTKLAEDAPASLKEYVADNLKYALRHHEIILRFGRFPHRNEILGRESTEAERAFLTEPMSSF
jgi:uncharacterized protein (DUF924 family)